MDIRLPKLGENAEGGTVVSLLVKEGDTVTKGQTILELENEKAVAPIPATAAGVVSQIRVKEGDRLLIGQVILSLAGNGETAGAASPSAIPVPREAASKGAALASASTVVAPPSPSAAPVSLSGFLNPAPDAPQPAASPEVRRMARELGLDLRRVLASGSGGRVLVGDLRDYLARLHAALAAAQSSPNPTASASTHAARAVNLPESIDFSQWGPVKRVAMTSLRKTISRRMVENWNTIPHVTQFDDVDITGLLELRKKFAAEYEAKGAKLTLTSFALKAVVATLQKHPIFNSSIDERTQEVVTKEYYHIGLAVDTEQGLIVPVLRNVDQKSLFQLSKEVSDLAGKARDRRVALDELKGGTFTISNQGGIGGAHFTPIVNKPEVAILGLGKGSLQPVVLGKDGKIVARLLMPLALSYDHRVIDGGTAARFTVDLLAAFQNFTEADLKLS